jgi:hypothetical protein
MEMVDLKKILATLRETKGKVYAPVKYFKGLKTKQNITTRYQRILKGDSYKPFKTDKGMKTKRSKYTTAFTLKYPNAKDLRSKARVTGIPYKIIKEVYNKGLAAWKTGHRPGATAQQWGYARVHSFIMKGCTYYTADKYLIKEAKKTMKPKDYTAWISRKKLC